MNSTLQDFELIRAGNLVTVQWRGSPKFSMGVLSTQSEPDAFDRAASALDGQGSRPGFSDDELKICVKEIRKRALRLRGTEPPGDQHQSTS